MSEAMKYMLSFAAVKAALLVEQDSSALAPRSKEAGNRANFFYSTSK